MEEDAANQAGRLVRDPSGPQTGNLEIEVSAYSVGWEEVARVWLAGVCGWYILGEPAEEYRPVWIDLIRATTLFYKFSNIHAEAMKNRRATGDVRINKLFFKAGPLAWSLRWPADSNHFSVVRVSHG